VHHAGQVGGTQLVEGREQVRRTLGVLLKGESGDGVPVDDPDCAAPADPPDVVSDRDFGQQPVTRPAALHRDVGHRHDLIGLAQGDLPVEQVAEHQGLGIALGETAQAHGSGRHDRAGFDAGHPGDREEDRPARGHFDHEPQDPGLLGTGSQQHDDVADPADLVAIRIEDDNAGEARDKHPRHRPAHVRRLPPRGPRAPTLGR